MNILFSIDEKLIKVNQLVCWGRYIKAKRLLDEILEEEPDYAPAHYELGKIYSYQLYNFQMAEYHYKLAMQFAPEFVWAYYAYQQILLRQSKHDELITFSIKALTVKSIYKSVVHKNMGLSFEEHLQLKKAKKEYEKSLLFSLSEPDTTQINQLLERIKNKQEKRKGEKKKVAVK